MGYRETWFNANPGKRRLGRTGVWYKCVKCKGWFRKKEIDIDHRIPKRQGGTDDLWNLQPMCQSCNRRKKDNQSGLETATTMFQAATHGQLGKALGGMAKQKIKDAFGIKYVRK